MARSAPPRLRAVTFDGWGTLFLDSPAADEGYRRQRLAGIGSVLGARGVAVDAPDLERAYVAAGQRLARLWEGSRDLDVGGHVTALLEAVDPALPSRLSADALDELVDAYSVPALRVPPAVDPGARATLDALAARGLALGIVSNTMRTPGRVLRQVLDRAGLLAPFSAVTFSDERGIRKPDPEIFRLTLRELGVDAAEAVHVGDDPVLDVEGARDAGLRVVQVAGRDRGAAPVRPDATIRSLADLPAALDQLDRSSR